MEKLLSIPFELQNTHFYAKDTTQVNLIVHLIYHVIALGEVGSDLNFFYLAGRYLTHSDILQQIAQHIALHSGEGCRRGEALEERRSGKSYSNT